MPQTSCSAHPQRPHTGPPPRVCSNQMGDTMERMWNFGWNLDQMRFISWVMFVKSNHLSETMLLICKMGKLGYLSHWIVRSPFPGV